MLHIPVKRVSVCVCAYVSNRCLLASIVESANASARHNHLWLIVLSSLFCCSTTGGELLFLRVLVLRACVCVCVEMLIEKEEGKKHAEQIEKSYEVNFYRAITVSYIYSQFDKHVYELVHTLFNIFFKNSNTSRNDNSSNNNNNHIQ